MVPLSALASPPNWLPVAAAEQVVEPVTASDEYTLSAVVVPQNGEAVAVVNDRVVRVGDHLGSRRVMVVTRDAVQLGEGANAIRLTFPGALPHGCVHPESGSCLEFHETDVKTAVRLMAHLTGRNIALADAVQGAITASLSGIDLSTALRAVLETNGFGLVESGNVTQVVTAAEWSARQEDLVVATFPLHHAAATEVLTNVTAFLSGRGSASADAALNEIFVRDLRASVRKIGILIARMDRRYKDMPRADRSGSPDEAVVPAGAVATPPPVEIRRVRANGPAWRLRIPR